MSYRQTDICNIALLISKGVFSSESRDTHASCFNVLQAPRQAKNSFCVVCNPSNATKRNVCRAALSCALQKHINKLKLKLKLNLKLKLKMKLKLKLKLKFIKNMKDCNENKRDQW